VFFESELRPVLISMGFAARHAYQKRDDGCRGQQHASVIDRNSFLEPHRPMDKKASLMFKFHAELQPLRGFADSLIDENHSIVAGHWSRACTTAPGKIWNGGESHDGFIG
jgi:hypothetical protein